MKHLFAPFILKDSKSILIGTLPPEGIDFFYSNSSNNRMWDILLAIKNDFDEIPKNNYKLPKEQKIDILKSLNLSMFDIIFEYERRDLTTHDKDIIPKSYSDILKLIQHTKIENIFFVYQSAAKWFMHSLKKEAPLELNKLSKKIDKSKSPFLVISHQNKNIKCFLLPNPLSRGVKGITLKKKKEIYKNYIQ